MNFDNIISQTGKKLKASEIRELLKLLDKPEMISFAGGLPNPDAFPIEKLKPVINHVMDNHARQALQYAPTEGHNKLRDAIVKGMKDKYGVKQKIDNIIITSGSQQALSLLSLVLLNPDDIVITGNPTYLAGISAFGLRDINFETISVTKNGIDVDQLEKKLSFLKDQNKTPKYIYIMPNFQNPTGVTIPDESRKKIYKLICEYDTILIEDDPYGLLRYSGKNIPLIKSYDVENRVLYISTFSKILAPGYRIAWIAGPQEIIRKVCLAKQATDLCTNTFGQYCVYEAIHHKVLFPHLENIITIYKKKRDLMLEAMNKYFPEEVTWNNPEGGLFVWVNLPKNIDSFDLLPKALENNVAYVIGSPFFPNGGGQNNFRMNFSYACDENIDIGIKRLGDVIKSEIFKKKKELDNDFIEIF